MPDAYRYHLTRRWGSEPVLPFIMLNPSTADETLDDPTIRRCIGFARREGAGGIRVANLYGFRATDPHELTLYGWPEGPLNDQHLSALAAEAAWDGQPIVVAWGANAPKDRVARLIEQLEPSGVPLVCLGVTRSGSPRHPLYVRGDAPLIPWPVDMAGPLS